MHSAGSHYQALPVNAVVYRNRACAVGGNAVTTGDNIFGERHAAQNNVIWPADQRTQIVVRG